MKDLRSPGLLSIYIYIYILMALRSLTRRFAPRLHTLPAIFLVAPVACAVLNFVFTLIYFIARCICRCRCCGAKPRPTPYSSCEITLPIFFFTVFAFAIVVTGYGANRGEFLLAHVVELGCGSMKDLRSPRLLSIIYWWRFARSPGLLSIIYLWRFARPDCYPLYIGGASLTRRFAPRLRTRRFAPRLHLQRKRQGDGCPGSHLRHG